MAALNDYVGAFANDTAADAYLTGLSYAKEDGLMYRDTTYGVLKQYDGQQTKWVSVGSAKAFFTVEGGLAVLLINKTGGASVKGSLVEASTAQDSSFALTGVSDHMPIGAVYESGIADGDPCFVVVAGVAEVLLENTTASTHGNWVYTSATGGRANATLAAPPGGGIPELEEHMREIGHCLESKGAGTDVLAKILMHFN